MNISENFTVNYRVKSVSTDFKEQPSVGMGQCPPPGILVRLNQRRAYFSLADILATPRG
jgi:hypothetical protein